MNSPITNVGELIDALQKFDRGLPVLKADACGMLYLPVDLLENLVFPVQWHCSSGGIDTFADADGGGRNFDAVVL